jgi:hypothetical protein
MHGVLLLGRFADDSGRAGSLESLHHAFCAGAGDVRHDGGRRRIRHGLGWPQVQVSDVPNALITSIRLPPMSVSITQ